MGVYAKIGPSIAGGAYQIPPVTYPFLKRNPLFRGFILKFLAPIPSPPPGPDISGLFFCPAQRHPGAGKSPRPTPLDLDSARRNLVNRAKSAALPEIRHPMAAGGPGAAQETPPATGIPPSRRMPRLPRRPAR